MQIRVYYEDTDCGGIMYHANYFKFCERARSEYFFMKERLPEWGSYRFVVYKIEAQYLAPARLGDMLQVCTRTKMIKKASLLLEQRIWRKDLMLFDMLIELACIKDTKSAKIPDELRTYLEWNEWKN